MEEIMKTSAEGNAIKPYAGRCYTSNELPISARTFFLSITTAANGHFSGEICNLFYEDAIPFNGLDEAILRMDKILDELGCPQPSTKLRSFQRSGTKHSRKKEETILQERNRRYQQYWNKDFMQSALSHRPQLQVEVLYRQNATWQGTIVLMQPLERKKANFRSVLELLHLIQSVHLELPSS